MRLATLLTAIALAITALPVRAEPEVPPMATEQNPMPSPPPGFDSFGGIEPDQSPDDEAAIVDGFGEVVMAERLSDARTPSIRKEFIKSVEASVGQDGSHPFEWALLDLNGDSYNDLVIQSRAPGLRDKPGFDGIRVMVYVFNGKTWTLALNSGAMNVFHKVVTDEEGVPHYQIACVQQSGYVLYEWDGKTFAKAPTVETSRWPKRDEGATKDVEPPAVVDGGTR